MSGLKAPVARALVLGALMGVCAAPGVAAQGPTSGSAPSGSASGQQPSQQPGATAGVAGVPPSMADTFDPTKFIGEDVKTALDALGAPKEMFPLRGQDDTQDNVVFFYPDYLYLFWFQNRVWQVRCDRRFTKPLFGMAMGMPREVIERTSARHFTALGDSLYFDVDDAKYPLRVRLVFANGALSDLYVYRSDF